MRGSKVLQVRASGNPTARHLVSRGSEAKQTAKGGLKTSHSVAKMQTVSVSGQVKQSTQLASGMKGAANFSSNSTKAVPWNISPSIEAPNSPSSPKKHPNNTSQGVRASTDVGYQMGASAAPGNLAVTGSPKLLTLAHLKSLIREMYTSKAQHDEKCLASGVPLET